MATTVFLQPASAGPDNINDSGVITVFGSLSSFFFDGVGPTLNAGDSIQNVANLIITDGFGAGFDIIPAGAFLANIANVSLLTAGNAGAAGQPFDTSPFSGIGTLTVSSSGAFIDNVNAGPTTAISINQNSTGSDAGVDVTGGSNVFVTSYGGSEASSGSGGVIVGSTNLGSVPLPVQTPTGAVFVTENGEGSVSVLGGTTVTVVAGSTSYSNSIEIGNTSDNTGDSAAAGFTNPTGAIVVADNGASNGSDITVYGGSSVFVAAAGDHVEVGDSGTNAPLNNTTGSITVDDIAPVTLTNLGGVENNIHIHGGSTVTVFTNTGSVYIGGHEFTPAGTLQPGVLPTGNVAVTDTALNDEAFVYIAGGANVSVAASGDTVQVGDWTGSGATGVAAVPTGAVTVTDFSTVVYDNILNTDDPYVEVFGGTNVNIAANSVYGVFVGDDDVGQPVAVNPTGTVTVTDLATYDEEEVEIFGGTNVTVFTEAGSVFIGDGTGGFNPTGNVVVAEIGVNTGYQYFNDIFVGGGVAVTVVTTGASEGITVGSDIASGGSPVTGAVTIYDLYSGRQHDGITVLGGTTVSINDTASIGNSINVGESVMLNIAGTSATNLADDPTGTVQIDDSSTFGSKTTFGTEGFNVVTNGSAVVYVQGGSDGNITDAQSTLTSAGLALGTSHLQTVILDGVTDADVLITSDALANLTIANTSTPGLGVVVFDDTANAALTVTLGFATDVELIGESQGGFTGPAPFIGLLAVNTVGTGANDIFLDMPGVTLLAINAGTGSSLTLDGGAEDMAAVKKVLVTGGGSVDLNDFSGATPLALIDASGNSGGVGVEINPMNTSFKGGSGTNTLVLDQNALGAGVSLNGGGGGDNTVYAAYAAAAGDVALGNIGFGKFTNFQSFGVVGALAGSTAEPYNVEGFGNLIVGGFNVPGQAAGFDIVGGPIDFTNVATGASLTLDTQNNEVTYSLQTPAAKGSLTITDGVDHVTTGLGENFVDLTGDTITSVTVNSLGVPTPFSEFNFGTVNELFLTGTPALSSVTITGDVSILVESDTTALKSVDASASSGALVEVESDGLAATGITVKGGSGLIVAEGVTASTAAVDTYDIGSGGGLIVVGAGGAGYAAGTGLNTGSETINLTAGAPVGTTIEAFLNVDAGGDGSFAVVNGWNFGTIGSGQTADSLLLEDDLGVVTNPVVIANQTNVHQGLAIYNVSNGVISLAPGSGTVSGSQELTDAEAIVDAAATPGTIAMVTVPIVTGGPSVATFVIEEGSGGVKTDTFVELTGVSAVTGFGAVVDEIPNDLADIGAGSSVSLNTTDIVTVFANVSKANGGTAAGQTNNDLGFAIDTLTISAPGTTNTYNNLGNFAVLSANTTGGGNVVVTQVGADPVLTLSAQGDVTLNNFTYGTGSVDPALLLFADNGSIDIAHVIDGSNTATTLVITGDDAGANSVTVGGVTDTALTTINADGLVGALTLTAAQNGLTILDQAGTLLGAAPATDPGAATITASGNGDTIDVGAAGHNDTGIVMINAAGTADHISVFGGGDALSIGAAGNGDVISVANDGGDTVYVTGNGTSFGSSDLTTQLGANDTINVSDADLHAWLGANSTVNISTKAGGSVDLHLLGDTAGASGTNLTTITGVTNGDQVRLHFNDNTPGDVTTNITESWAGDGSSVDSQVNVATAATLQQALSLAASQALVMDQQFGGGNTTVVNQNLPNASLQENAMTGLLDWFQFGGNTYLVEAVNSTATNATHAALGAHDIVVELTGIVDANQITFVHH